MKLIVHIGGEKTGTTSIQSTMTKHTRQLKAQRILWPTHPCCFHENNHGPAVASLLSRDEVTFLPSSCSIPSSSEVANYFREAVRSTEYDRIVISAEWFSSRLNKERILAFRELLGPIEAQILYYARRQDDLLMAAFFTDIMTGRPTWLDLKSIDKNGRFLNHALLLKGWADAFGEEAISVVDYNVAAKNDIIKDFFERICFSYEPKFAKRLNESRSLPVVRLFYLLNRQAHPRSRKGEQDFVDSLFDHSSMLQCIARLLPTDSPPWNGPPLKSILSPADRSEILALFEADNMAMARKFKIDLSWYHSESAAHSSASPAPDLPNDEELLAGALLELFQPDKTLPLLSEIMRLRRAIEPQEASREIRVRGVTTLSRGFFRGLRFWKTLWNTMSQHLRGAGVMEVVQKMTLALRRTGELR